MSVTKVAKSFPNRFAKNTTQAVPNRNNGMFLSDEPLTHK
jgi:hypothetical protein